MSLDRILQYSYLRDVLQLFLKGGNSATEVFATKVKPIPVVSCLCALCTDLLSRLSSSDLSKLLTLAGDGGFERYTDFAVQVNVLSDWIKFRNPD